MIRHGPSAAGQSASASPGRNGVQEGARKACPWLAPILTALSLHLGNESVSVPIQDGECGFDRRLGDVASLEASAKELGVVELTALVDVNVAEEGLGVRGGGGEGTVEPLAG